MAIALSHDGKHLGHVATETLVRNDLILSPTVPLTLTPGDESEINVVIANNTNKAQRVNLKATLEPQLSFIGEAEKVIDIAPMSESRADFVIKATQELGSTTIRFIASYEDAQQQKSMLSVMLLFLFVQLCQNNLLRKFKKSRQENCNESITYEPLPTTSSAVCLILSCAACFSTGGIDLSNAL